MIKQVLTIIIGTVVVILVLTLFELTEWSLFEAAITAGVINGINALAAYFFFEKSYRKPNNTFLLYNLGGMGIRLIFLLVVVFIVIKFLKIDKYAFIFLFFIFYFTSLFFEVNYFRKKVITKNKSK